MSDDEIERLRAELAAERERAEKNETECREAMEDRDAIAAFRDELRAELAAERERAVEKLAIWREQSDADERMIYKLREALEPFAKEASVWDGYADEEILVEQFPDLPGVAALTVGDLRRARAAREEARKG